MYFTTPLPLMMKRSMIGCSYVCAGLPAISLRSLFLNLFMKTMERWVDGFRGAREICSDRGLKFVSQHFQTLFFNIGARSTMCLAGRHQDNGTAEDTGKQLSSVVAKAFTSNNGTF